MGPSRNPGESRVSVFSNIEDIVYGNTESITAAVLTRVATRVRALQPTNKNCNDDITFDAVLIISNTTTCTSINKQYFDPVWVSMT